MRWKLKIQEFDFELKHVLGVENRVADVLSRIDTGPECEYEIDEPTKVCKYLACLRIEDPEDIKTQN